MTTSCCRAHPARRDRHRGPAAPRRPRAGDRRRRAGARRWRCTRHGGVGAITLVDHDTVDLTNPAAPDRAHGWRGASPRWRRRRRRCRHQPGGARRRCSSAPMRRCWTRLVAAGRRGARLQRQLRHPPGRQRRLRAPPPAAGVGRGDRLRRPDLGLRHARAEATPATPACSRPRRTSRRRAARRWACSRRWWASSARCRRPRR